MTYLGYSASVETVSSDEAETFRKIAETFAAMGKQVEAQEGRAVRVSHAKATALLTGELIVDDGLPPELAQGIAASAGRYEAIVRFAQGPGEILHDRISTHRGIAIKLLGIEGERIAEAEEGTSQDFVLEARSKAFITSNAATFLAHLKAGVSNAPSLSEGVKNAVSKVAHAAEAGLEAVGLDSKLMSFFGHPPLHPLAEGYFSQVAMRWGDHVGKIGLFPSQGTLDGLAELKIEGRDHDSFREAMAAHFAAAGAEFDLRVQLATDLDSNPIEDASKEWPEDDNPYRSVARLVLPPQRAWSPERAAYSERLSFRPANSLAAHRPLGQVMRARLFVYEKLADLRHRSNGEVVARPRTAGEVPA